MDSAGERCVYGFRGLTQGDFNATLKGVLTLKSYGAHWWATACVWPTPSSSPKLSRTTLLRAGGYGEEVKFGGGNTICDGMAQSQRSRAGAARRQAVDTVPDQRPDH